MNTLAIRFLREESGEDLIEYGLLCAFVAAVATAVIIADPLGIKTSLLALARIGIAPVMLLITQTLFIGLLVVALIYALR
ncbi:MAG: hypothetical protein HYR73_04840, partial [Candidatus Eisenbacteria bacterium]|nr:hypothetical protein [Candidatus Eisenbacteria bacterium]